MTDKQKQEAVNEAAEEKDVVNQESAASSETDTQALEEEASEKAVDTETAETAEDVETSESEDQEEKKKGLFNKKKDKKDKKDVQIEELNDRLVRQMAEFENFRKRTEKEKAQMFDMGAKSIIEKIIPVIDNFERGLALATEEQLEDPFVDGMNRIYKQIITMFEEVGVKPIEAVGAEFDPNYHNAVMHVESEELGENVVAEELQKGYLYRDTVVRHSMVKVAN